MTLTRAIENLGDNGQGGTERDEAIDHRLIATGDLGDACDDRGGDTVSFERVEATAGDCNGTRAPTGECNPASPVCRLMPAAAPLSAGRVAR